MAVITKNDLSWNVPNADAEAWQQVSTGAWEPKTYEVFDRILDAEHTYIDVGAWIGPTVLYAAQRAKLCYAMEPDPVAYAKLVQNLRLNVPIMQRVRLTKECLAHYNGPIVLHNRTSLGGDSMSSTVDFENDLISWNVVGIELVDYALKYGVENCNFIKIDIEGGEFELARSGSLAEGLELLGWPAVWLSLHPGLFTLTTPEAAKAKMAPIRSLVSLYRYSSIPADELKSQGYYEVLLSMKEEHVSPKSLVLERSTKNA